MELQKLDAFRLWGEVETVVALIIGDSRLLTVLRSHVPEQRWRAPVAGDYAAQADFLIRHPVPSDKKGFVLTNMLGNWLPVADAGWTVYWCEQGQVPVGAQPLPNSFIGRSITDFIREFWGITSIDKRIVGDVLLNRVRPLAQLLPVTSNTGGVGKTVTCRRLAERASAMRMRTLLIDGNMRQSSQRSFFDPARTHNVTTIASWRAGMKAQRGANPGKLFEVSYDLTFAPPVGTSVDWNWYREYIEEARKLWDFVILDLDRISADDLTDQSTAASELIVPYLQSGESCLVIVKAGRQTQGDAMNLLSAFRAHGLPRECIGIKDTVPVGMSEYQHFDYSSYGTFLGTEYQSTEASNHIAAGDSNWADPQLDFVREQVLAWSLPDKGFNPEQFKPQPKKKGWFHR